MKKEIRLISLLLSLAILLTMIPLTSFADEFEADGTKEKPFLLEYRPYKTYSGYGSHIAGVEMWFELDVKEESKQTFQTGTYENTDEIKSIQLMDSDKETVIGEFAYDSTAQCYTLNDMDFSAKKYYFYVQFNIYTEHEMYISNVLEKDPEYAGTEEDPIIVKYDAYSVENKYYVDNTYLKEDATEVWYQIDSKADEYNDIFINIPKTIGIASVELLDSEKTSIEEFQQTEYSLDEENETASYLASNCKFVNGETYYVKISISKSVENEMIELSITAISGNGLKEYPFLSEFYEFDTGDFYYSSGIVYKGMDEIWFKAEVQKDAKISAYIMGGNGLDERDIIESATFYYRNNEIDMEKSDISNNYYTYDYYTSLKKGEIIWVKLSLNDQAVVGDEVFMQLSCFSISNVDIVLDNDEFTWNGKAKKPSLAYIYYKGYSLRKGVDYKSVTYKSNTDMGYGEVVVTGMGKYPGKACILFEIHPKTTTLDSVTASKNSATVKWTPLKTKMSKAHITGYQIQYSTNSNFTNAKSLKVKGYANTTKKITKLTSKKKYYVRIRTYYVEKTYGNTLYSKWSTVRTVKLK